MYKLIKNICLAVILLVNLYTVFAQISQRFEHTEESYITCTPDYVRLRWSGKVFLAIEANESRSPTICIASKDGLIERRSFQIPNVGYIFVYDVTGSIDGTIALVGSTFSNDSQLGSFVARISPDRKDTIITPVRPYIPRKVTIAADGSLWTVGWIMNEATRDRRENNILKRFDATGKLTVTLRPVIVRTKGQSISPPDMPDISTLRSSRDRIAWLSSSNEYFEFSTDVREITHLDGPPLTEKNHRPVTMALSDDNQVFSGAQGTDRWVLWTLDRKKNEWTSIETSDGLLQWGELLGFDQDMLVTGFDGKAVRYKRK